jgi:PAS domain S-box-containing protein/putative nucleotidyltransferase with HDIG domain
MALARRIASELTFARAGGWAGRVTLAAVLLAALLGLAALAAGPRGDALLFLLVVPLALAASAHGLRGALALAALGSLVASAWWMQEGSSHGHAGAAHDLAWLAVGSASFLFVGALLGGLVESYRRALQALAHHRELSLDLIATASFEGIFTEVNPAFTTTLGWSATELCARPFLDFVHPDDREPTLEALAQQTEQGREVLHFQNRYRTKDGSYRWLEWTSRPDPQERSLIAVARDVTERKRLEEREHAYQARLEQAVRERTTTLLERNAELEEARRETLRRLALAAEYRDDDTYEHTERIGRAAARLAQALGLAEEEVSLLGEAAPLHDIGKLAVPDGVLLKPGPLSEQEEATMRRHTIVGAAILAGSSSPVLRAAEEIARSHHEWWDGSGYPDGLRGAQIPLFARIVALADVFDALTHRRPYKAPWPLEEAVAEIRRLRGRQFDPQVVDAFETIDPAWLADLDEAERPAA